MKNKKYLFLKEVLITLCLVSTFNVFAHPGRTDANGGHWDRSNGTYHFHTGEYAGRSSSGTADSSDSEPKPFVPPYEPPENNPYKKEVDSKEQTPIVALILCVVFLFVPLGFGVVSVVGIVATLIHEKFIQGKLPIHKIMTLDKKIDELCEYQKATSRSEIIKNNCTKLQKEILVLYKKCNSPKTKCLIIFSKKSKSALQEVNKKYKELHKKEIA